VTEPDADFERLLQFLKENRGFDFTGYKRASLMRRVGRQMQTVGLETYEEYQDFLELHPEQFTALFNTILINVTGFFRDADAWEALAEHAVPALLGQRPTGPIRVWSAGCASGEEAYSLAIVLAESLGVEEFRERVKIYATDVDEDALAEARSGTYDEKQVSGVSASRRETYFEHDDGAYVFRKDLRRSVIFGRNDLVQEAPISRIDLLACRNTLMYFNAEQQGRILRRLHFALDPDGLLFLGKAELLLGQGGLFEPFDLKRRFFSKVSHSAPLDRRSPPDQQLALGRTVSRDGAQRLREQALLSSPIAQVVVDEDGMVTLVNHRAESMFGLSTSDLGRQFHDLEVSYRPVELRSRVAQARGEMQPVWVRGAEWVQSGGDAVYLDVQIVPLVGSPGQLLGISLFFNDVTRFRRLNGELEFANRQMETAYEELQSTNEELETTQEELHSTVEELETTNEELQSTNEELETMNEELQSMNDELQSSNAEVRVHDLDAFMHSVLESLAAAVAVVDRDGRVQLWNRQATELWGVRADEAVGRGLVDLDIGLPVTEVDPLVRRVLAQEDGDALELDAVNRRGRHIRVRVGGSPVRGADGQVGGAILVVDQLPDGSG